ncbi:peptidoglycan-binding protein [Fulvivirga sp. M361]|uniref:peptidoglycan-binding domain-containing protein n=1 Tax=Fulvivirga sp. M361 TaxID=2594266 RepID=UPI00117B59BD|nr:peptidoglycan-binding domain-containing protein [Fulvivirga sp. M361]TRX52385.1 peptidoglycan-binding protein [Fulvivirga sp. M361]
MKRLLMLIITLSLLVIAYFQYENYTRYRPPFDHTYAVNDSIDPNYYDPLLLDQYIKNSYEIGAFARRMWFQKGIDVEYPDDSEESLQASTHYNHLIASTKRMEKLLIYSGQLKQQGFNNTAIQKIIEMGLAPDNYFFHENDKYLYLKLGDQSNAVYEIQKILIEKGYTIPLDGNFGQETENAIKTLQRDFNLYPSGIIDKETITTLKTK